MLHNGNGNGFNGNDRECYIMIMDIMEISSLAQVQMQWHCNDTLWFIAVTTVTPTGPAAWTVEREWQKWEWFIMSHNENDKNEND